MEMLFLGLKNLNFPSFSPYNPWPVSMDIFHRRIHFFGLKTQNPLFGGWNNLFKLDFDHFNPSPAKENAVFRTQESEFSQLRSI